MRVGRLYVISDDHSICTGLGLAGVDGQLAYTEEELRQVLADIGCRDASHRNNDCGALVIITSGLAARCEEFLHEYRTKNQLPLITVIPDTDIGG